MVIPDGSGRKCYNVPISIPYYYYYYYYYYPHHHHHHHLHSYFIPLHLFVIYTPRHSVTLNIKSNGRVTWLRMNRKGHGGSRFWLCLRYNPEVACKE
jgi:hypothetical protein